jgi:hypothetical protein
MIATMACDEDVANRIRGMFGGIGFIIDGHMAVGVSG